MMSLKPIFSDKIPVSGEQILERMSEALGLSPADALDHLALLRHVVHNMMVDECDQLNRDAAVRAAKGLSAFEVVSRALRSPEPYRLSDSKIAPLAMLLDQIPGMQEKVHDYVFLGVTVRVDIDPHEFEAAVAKFEASQIQLIKDVAERMAPTESPLSKMSIDR